MSALTLVKLRREGHLAAGDFVSTPHLGRCIVADIESTTTIIVRDAYHTYHRLSVASFGTDARMRHAQNGGA